MKIRRLPIRPKIDDIIYVIHPLDDDRINVAPYRKRDLDKGKEYVSKEFGVLRLKVYEIWADQINCIDTDSNTGMTFTIEKDDTYYINAQQAEDALLEKEEEVCYKNEEKLGTAKLEETLKGLEDFMKVTSQILANPDLEKSIRKIFKDL